ncbi:MAG: hypothetical protein M3340_09470 [Actinomycetota bacterium]|nr:hypothetical protein [Actinomycetota bacterium]
MSEHVSLRMALLDKQLVDREERPFGRVDDLELTVPPDGAPPRVTAILTGAEALGPLLGGRVGRWMAGAAARLRPRSHPEGPTRVEIEHVDELEPLVRLEVPLRDLEHVAGLERWLAHNLIERLPGAGDARD